MKYKEKNIFDRGREIAENISLRMRNLESNESIDEWMIENEFSKEIIDKFTAEDKFSQMCSEFNVNNEVQVKRLANEINRREKRKLFVRLIMSSAAVIFAISFLLIYNDAEQPIELGVPHQGKTTTNQQNVPILILDNGKTVDLSEKEALIGAQRIGDSLKYSSEVVAVSENKPKYNTLILPEKCVYFITLSDGTNVYLNANSTLKYPVLFFGENREVLLSGEAFFEVKKDTEKPFIVISGDTRIRVYGTKFNVNSYNSELIKTSLISGSVGVKMKGYDEVVVKPGQMLLSNTTIGENSVMTINSHKYEAWRQGFFRCDNEDISIILEDIAAWYGVTFEYEFKESKHTKISASIDRNLPIEEVIELLKVTSNVKFKKKGETIYTIR